VMFVQNVTSSRIVHLLNFGFLKIPINPFDNALAVDQMEVAYSTLLARPVARGPNVEPATSGFSKDGVEHPRIVS